MATTPAPLEGSTSAGTLVGPYRLGAPIGSGGMGVVHEAELTGGALVAVKLLHREWLTDDFVRRRFDAEAIAGRLVRHQNVAAVIERGQTDQGVPFIAMERVRGEPLGRRLEREGPFSPRRAAAIVGQILAGLEAMHHAGIVHGDVKCDNVMVETLADGSEVVKLVDFGLARVQLDARADPHKEGLIAGTPEYMAPEVIRGRGSSPGSDLYAAGVILYELLTGKTPFSGGTPGLVLQRHLEDDPVPPSCRPSRWCTPRALERVVGRALEKDPRRRYASATAFAIALACATPMADEPRPVVSRVERTLRDQQPTYRWKREVGPRNPARRRQFASGTPAHHLRTPDRPSSCSREHHEQHAPDPRRAPRPER